MIKRRMKRVAIILLTERVMNRSGELGALSGLGK